MLPQVHQQREELKANYLRFKGSCRDEIDRIQDKEIQQDKRSTLRKLQDRYQKTKNDYKVLGILDYIKESEREELFKGADLSKPGIQIKEEFRGIASLYFSKTRFKCRK